MLHLMEKTIGVFNENTKCTDHGRFEMGRDAVRCLAKPEVGRKAESFDIRCIAVIVTANIGNLRMHRRRWFVFSAIS